MRWREISFFFFKYVDVLLLDIFSKVLIMFCFRIKNLEPQRAWYFAEFRFSRRWRFKSSFSGLWHRVVLW